MEAEGPPIAAKMELLASFTELLLARILDVVHQKNQGPLTGEQKAHVERVRAEIQTSFEAVNRWVEEHPESEVDLRGLRERLAAILEKIDVELMGDTN
jgi:hypothetical protein